MFPEFKTLFSNIYGDSAISILKEYGSPTKLAKAHISKVASPRVCHLQKNILKVEQRIYVICLTFFAEYDIINT